MATIKHTMATPIPGDPNTVHAVVDEANDGKKAVPVELVTKNSDDSTFTQVTDTNPIPTKLTGSNVELAAAGVATDPKDVGLGFSALRVNIWGAPFSVKIEGQMWDGTWYTLPASDAITGNDVTSPITANGVYDFDVAGWAKVKATVTSGSVNVKGALLP